MSYECLLRWICTIFHCIFAYLHFLRSVSRGQHHCSVWYWNVCSAWGGGWISDVFWECGHWNPEATSLISVTMPLYQGRTTKIINWEEKQSCTVQQVLLSCNATISPEIKLPKLVIRTKVKQPTGTFPAFSAFCVDMSERNLCFLAHVACYPSPLSVAFGRCCLAWRG